MGQHADKLRSARKHQKAAKKRIVQKQLDRWANEGGALPVERDARQGRRSG
ncbi:hypothetical protein [Ruicaihuangia caeni]|uniref:Uncharacterized protein n=1 Tax=Ruicaihuangia caeni TaxID=3042517 RepID=A0AAW6T129_9MICO|nr:hypothetical protein [Klugiella sp. YN-L-19]MDI2097535.1 hypothetical protein [Klugiella sp. YN-L-19]